MARAMKFPRSAALAGFVVAAALLVSACPAELENRERFLACGDVPQTIFAKTCLDVGCHNTKDLAGQLDLQSPDVALRVAFVPSPNCDEMLADPTDPTQSLIYKKTAHTTKCGDPMPLNGAPLSPRQLWCIREWIADLGQLEGGAEAAAPDGESDASTSRDASGAGD
jgi:hypothetical protein